MPTESFENTNFDAMNGFEVTVMKFIQWYRGEVGSGGAGVPVSPAGSFPIPPYDQQVFDYFLATNNVQTITYKKDGATVAILTFTYVGGGAADDDNVATITQS